MAHFVTGWTAPETPDGPQRAMSKLNPEEPTMYRGSYLRRTARARMRRRMRRTGDWTTMSVIVVPALGLYFTLVLLPAALTVWYSLTDWNGIASSFAFIGVKNYANALTDPDVRHAFVVTLVLTTLSTALNFVLGLAMALALQRRSRINLVYRTIIFLPVVIASVVVGFIWRGLLGTDGIADNLYMQFTHSTGGLGLLSNPVPALCVLVLAVVWQGLGFSTMIFLAGLMTVPGDLKEAAQIDGAGPWTAFRSVIFPMLAPATTIVVLNSVIGGLQEYDRVVALTNGGPAGATTTNSFKIIQDAFGNNRLAYGCAEAVMLMVIVIAMSIMLTTLLRRREADL